MTSEQQFPSMPTELIRQAFAATPRDPEGRSFRDANGLPSSTRATQATWLSAKLAIISIACRPPDAPKLSPTADFGALMAKDFVLPLNTCLMA